MTLAESTCRFHTFAKDFHAPKIKRHPVTFDVSAFWYNLRTRYAPRVSCTSINQCLCSGKTTTRKPRVFRDSGRRKPFPVFSPSRPPASSAPPRAARRWRAVTVLNLTRDHYAARGEARARATHSSRRSHPPSGSSLPVSSASAFLRFSIAVGTSSNPKAETANLACFCASATDSMPIASA